ncbi:low-affinity Zn(2+) transporter ZRT2, partial [Ascoidea rubescens DSM 1968]
ECESGNDYNDQFMGIRISSIFVILVTSTFAALFPVLSSRYSFIKLPSWCFFICKYFGTGVILATTFIHLLTPAVEYLGHECLGGTFAEYPWAFAITFMTLVILFFIEMVIYHYIKNFSNSSSAPVSQPLIESNQDSIDEDKKVSLDKDLENSKIDPTDLGSFTGQLISIFVLEFGIIFHSVFVGLALAVSGDEFKTLYVVIVFHQVFEGLGLGARIAITDWPKEKRFTPYVLALGYGLSTPISIAIGLGVRNSYSPGSRTALITNGIFDSISAGILLYTSIVELMAHELLFTEEFDNKPEDASHKGTKKMFAAYGLLCLGGLLMALLGKWA